MAPVATNDIIRVTARMRLLDSEDLINTYHIRIDSNTTANDDAFMDELATDVDASYQIINPDVSLDVDYIDIDAQNITQNELLPGKPWPVLVSGAEATQLLPPQVAAFAFFRTLRPKTRCGVYLGGFCENGNGPLAVIDAALATLIATFQTDIAIGWGGPNFSSTYGAYNRPLNRFTPVDQPVFPVRWRTQRRRRPGVGS